MLPQIGPYNPAYAPINQVARRERSILGESTRERVIRIALILTGSWLTIQSSLTQPAYKLSLMGALFLGTGIFEEPRAPYHLKKITLIALIILTTVGEGLMTARLIEREDSFLIKSLTATVLVCFQLTIALAGRAIGECMERN